MMTHSETRYEIMECEDEQGFMPSGHGEWTLEETEATLRELREKLPEVHRKAFICQVVTTRLGDRSPEIHHELQTIPTAS
ncbi:MAG: hypothetical protein ACREJN_02955 [Nitrospiraceae bacterium]